MKTRKRIVVAVVALSLLVGIGSVFAATDAGAQLQAWYEARFNDSFKEVEQDATNHGWAKFAELRNWWGNEEKEIGNNITRAADAEIGRAKGEIAAAQTGYQDDIEARKSEILDNMPAQYDTGVVGEAKAQIDDLREKAMDLAKPIAEEAVNGYGAEALTKVSADVGNQKDNAVNALTQTIDDAKKAIEDKIGEEEEIAKSEIKGYIDTGVGEAKGELLGYVNGLVDEQKGKITDEGTRIENEAKSELDELVKGIFVEGETE